MIICGTCGSRELTTGFRCTRCGADNLTAVQQSCQHYWEAVWPKSATPTLAPVSTVAKAYEHAAQIAESHAYCGCGGKHGACLADDPPNAIAADIRQAKAAIAAMSEFAGSGGKE